MHGKHDIILVSAAAHTHNTGYPRLTLTQGPTDDCVSIRENQSKKSVRDQREKREKEGGAASLSKRERETREIKMPNELS